MGNKGTQQEGVMELKEFVGQTTAVSSVSFSVEAAKKLGKMPDHMLFFGPPVWANHSSQAGGSGSGSEFC